ncbi:MAG: putative manganese-dependent inorganic diphosphatase [Clostridia bacterium]|nr:putative manganese-dependent inorganic diphosphatase [Clostridia bacterium]
MDNNNSKIYVIGHRNPDTDSVVSAMAYAALRNAVGDREFEAGRIDHCSDETKRLLEFFGLQAPTRIKDVRTQVKDLDFDTPPTLEPTVTLDHAWKVLEENGISSMPVVNRDGTLYGQLSAHDIATFDIGTIHNPIAENLPIFNLLGVIEGRIVYDGADMKTSLSGEVIIATPTGDESTRVFNGNSIVLCGSQPEVIRAAFEAEVSAIILCASGSVDEIIKDYPNSKTCVIYSPLDAARIARLLFLSTPIERTCSKEDIVCFSTNDYVDDVREKVLKSRFRCYPILDENMKVVGTLSRYHLLRPRRKRIVLVDHNEAAQAVPGFEQAELVAIIDHHRLADIETGLPIYVRNEPVGSTTTIVAEMYQERGVSPAPKMAGLMIGAILSDTVMFKSPTCTKRDIELAERLSRIAGVSIEEVGKVLFDSNSQENKSCEQLLSGDFKEFHIAGQRLGVAQITCVDSERFISRKEEFLETMSILKKKNSYDIVILMLTDVLIEGSELIFLGNEDTIRYAFNVEPKDNQVFLPGVMSRKKQIIPMLTALWG